MNSLVRSLSKTANSFRFAFSGLFFMLKNENNFRFHLFATIVAIVISISLRLTAAEWRWVIAMIGLVLTLETLNTAVERLADWVCPQHDARMGTVKDVAAGAVLLASITAFIIGLMIFYQAWQRLA